MSYPMRLTAKRLVESGLLSRVEVREQLEVWAERYGFQRAPDEADDFVYRRGSHWHAMYTFDIRKVPTEVRVRVIHDELGTCICSMSCGSWFQYSTPGDERRLSAELDLLEACLKGAFRERAMSADPDNTPNRDRNRGSQDIQEGNGGDRGDRGNSAIEIRPPR